MKATQLTSCLAIIPAAWLVASFVVPAETTDAYLPQRIKMEIAGSTPPPVGHLADATGEAR